MAEKKKPAQATTKSANVYERIANIQQSIHTVIKGGYNDHFKYKFARERDIVAEVKPLLGEQRLALTHGLVSEEREGELTKLVFNFRITNIDNPEDFVEGHGIGYGKDSQDKGAPKAYTMALKYYLSKQFLIETGDDAEESINDKKGKKASAESSETPEEKFEKAKRMIKASRNVDGLIEYSEKLNKGKSFNAAQKKELQALISARVDELSA